MQTPTTAVTPRWPVVIFDLDGTLVNSIDLIVTSYQYALRTVVGREWDEAEIRTWIGQSLRGSMERACPEHAEELLRVYSEHNHALTPTMLTGYPGILDLVRSLTSAGVRLGSATSKRAEPAQWALDLTHLSGLMPIIVSHDDVREHKPNPEPLLLAAARLNCEVGEAVYIGDAVVDIVAAHNAGMDCVGVTWGAGVREELVAAGPTLLVDTVDELGAALLGHA